MYSIWLAIKTWIINLVYGDIPDKNIKEWLDTNYPGWDEEALKEKEQAEIAAKEECKCALCGKSIDTVLVRQDEDGDLYCDPCWNIMYNPNMNYAEGIGYYKKLK